MSEFPNGFEHEIKLEDFVSYLEKFELERKNNKSLEEII